VCDLHRAQGDEERGFLGLASKPRSIVSPDLASKLVDSSFLIWASNWQLRFGDFGIKITSMVSWFLPQNKVGYGLSVVPQNR
jgi:hypothetical protein